MVDPLATFGRAAIAYAEHPTHNVPAFVIAGRHFSFLISRAVTPSFLRAPSTIAEAVDLFAVPAIGTLVAQSGCCRRGGCRVAAELHGRGAGMQLAISDGTSHQMRCS